MFPLQHINIRLWNISPPPRAVGWGQKRYPPLLFPPEQTGPFQNDSVDHAPVLLLSLFSSENMMLCG